MFAFLPLYFFWYARIFSPKSLYLHLNDTSSEKVSENPFRLAPFLPHFFYLLAISLVILALARPQYISQWENEELKGKDIYFVIDMSNSMVEEEGRLEELRSYLEDFISTHVENRFGIIVFGEEAFSYVPLTWDAKAVQRMLARMQPGLVPAEGTAMGNALYLALHRFEISQAPSPSILLFTDGGNTKSIISPLAAAKLAGQQQVPIYSFIWEPHPDSMGRMQSFLPDSYKEMGKLSGGQTQLIPYQTRMGDTQIDFASLESASRGTMSFRVAEDQYPYFVLGALVCLLLSFGIRSGSLGNPLEG